ncbi:MAG TPA: hypothetical protein VKB76_10600 [Ktedonobacterales bacterium]|nr:hypothetical protein [Ktedonobacterales bacterium]
MILAFALGVLVDAAIIISGIRYQMHDARGPKERKWKRMAQWMFTVCLIVESMTLAYFYKIIQPQSVPMEVAFIINKVHDGLYFFRSGLPPFIIAYLAVFVKALTFEREDRKRQMKADTSVRLMSLEAVLAKPGELKNKADLLRQYETQLVLNQYASEASDKEKAEDDWLLKKFREIWQDDGTPTDDSVWVTKDHLTNMLADHAEQSRAMLAEAIKAVEGKVLRLIAEVQRHAVSNGPPQAKWSRSKADAIQRGILGEEEEDGVLDGEGVS